MTSLKDNKMEVLDVNSFKFAYNSLIDLTVGKKATKLQYESMENDGIRYNFNFKGNKVEVSVYTPAQFKYVKYMQEKKVLDLAKNIISPMPGAIVSV